MSDQEKGLPHATGQASASDQMFGEDSSFATPDVSARNANVNPQAPKAPTEHEEAERCYAEALKLRERGFNVVPRHATEKRPSVHWKELQGRFATPDELASWRRKFAGGVGYITGEIEKGHGYVVLETDGWRGEEVLRQFEWQTGAKLPRTFTVRSGSRRGRHRHFRHPGHRVVTRANSAIELDVKGDGGFCVLPPSIHRSGKRYEILDDAEPAPLPDGLLEFVEEWAARPEEELDDFFLDLVARRFEAVGVDATLREILSQMEWPGNVNETQLKAVQELHRLEFSEDEAVTMILESTRRVAPEHWNWKDEEKKVRNLWKDWLSKNSGENSERSNDGRPIIKIKANNLSDATTAAEDALLTANVPIYQRGGVLVRPVIEEAAASHDRKTKVVRLVRVNEGYLRDVLNQKADFRKLVNKKWTSVNPPHETASTLLAREGEWKFPAIAGVISTPTMRPNGTIIEKEGYDPETRLLLVAPPPMAPIAEAPTRQDAVCALGLLMGLLEEFPIVDDVSRAVALSALITPIVRGAFPVAPMHSIRAPVAGSGKSYLLDCVAAMATGQIMPVMAVGRSEEETEKRLGAALLAGQPLISIDNVNGELRGDALCQSIERQIVEVRILGKSERVRIDASGTSIFATGNNIIIVGDLCRRVLTATLDPKMERPELRVFNGDPVARIMTDRGAYIAAALTICRAYVVAGQPDRAKRLASFESWSDTVRSALIWLGEADPADSIETARSDDPELADLREMLEAWGKVIGVGRRHRRTLAEIIDIANEHDSSFALTWPRLAAAIQNVAGKGRIPADARSLGNWLRGRKDRYVDGLRFMSSSNTKSTVWWVEGDEAPGQWGS